MLEVYGASFASHLPLRKERDKRDSSTCLGCQSKPGSGAIAEGRAPHDMHDSRGRMLSISKGFINGGSRLAPTPSSSSTFCAVELLHRVAWVAFGISPNEVREASKIGVSWSIGTQSAEVPWVAFGISPNEVREHSNRGVSSSIGTQSAARSAVDEAAEPVEAGSSEDESLEELDAVRWV